MSVYNITFAGVSGSAPNDGFIDPSSVYVYMNAGGAAPSTYALSIAKSRANRRYKWIILALINNGIQIVSTVAGGSPNSDTAPTSLVVQVVLTNSLSTPDETSPGNTLTDMAAVKRIAARAIVRTETLMLEALDPTAATAPGNTTSFARTGPRFDTQTVGNLYSTISGAEAGITVALAP